MRDPIPVTELAVREPFEVLYQREFRPMVRLATALVDEAGQAEEVVQEAFAALYVRYRVIDNPVAYLRVCVLNGGRKVLRRRRLTRQHPPIPDEPGDLVFNHVLDAVRRLPTRQRNAIVLRYELQLSDQEIAETLGVPVGTVKSTVHRALARLRTEVTR
ncbi:MAG: SigE family RNA polymerase sigma factor [Ilumatobacteraceae bacterium]